MNKLIKFAFLIIMLGIPVAIFIFLKLFGSNKFDVDIYYQQGVDSELESDCNFPDGQFYVNDDLLYNSSEVINVVGFSSGAPTSDFINIANRLYELFDKQVVMQLISDQSERASGNNFIVLDTDDVNQVIHCGFISNDIHKLVLVDNERRIRGYYSNDLDDVDRLIVELKILLENK